MDFDTAFHKYEIGSGSGIGFVLTGEPIKISNKLFYIVGVDIDNVIDSHAKNCARKLVKNIGFSVYNPSELTILIKRYNFDVVQAPFNIFDRRILKSGLSFMALWRISLL